MEKELNKVAKYNEPEDKLNLAVYTGVRKFKSVRRAIRRGNLTKFGEVVPARPFNNSKRTEGRKLQNDKEVIYGNIKHKLQLRKQTFAEESTEGGIQ